MKRTTVIGWTASSKGPGDRDWNISLFALIALLRRWIIWGWETSWTITSRAWIFWIRVSRFASTSRGWGKASRFVASWWWLRTRINTWWRWFWATWRFTRTTTGKRSRFKTTSGCFRWTRGFWRKAWGFERTWFPSRKTFCWNCSSSNFTNDI